MPFVTGLFGGRVMGVGLLGDSLLLGLRNLLQLLWVHRNLALLRYFRSGFPCRKCCLGLCRCLFLFCMKAIVP